MASSRYVRSASCIRVLLSLSFPSRCHCRVVSRRCGPPGGLGATSAGHTTTSVTLPAGDIPVVRYRAARRCECRAGPTTEVSWPRWTSVERRSSTWRPSWPATREAAARVNLDRSLELSHPRPRRALPRPAAGGHDRELTDGEDPKAQIKLAVGSDDLLALVAGRAALRQRLGGRAGLGQGELRRPAQAPQAALKRTPAPDLRLRRWWPRPTRCRTGRARPRATTRSASAPTGVTPRPLGMGPRPGRQGADGVGVPLPGRSPQRPTWAITSRRSSWLTRQGPATACSSRQAGTRLSRLRCGQCPAVGRDVRRSSCGPARSRSAAPVTPVSTSRLSMPARRAPRCRCRAGRRRPAPAAPRRGRPPGRTAPAAACRPRCRVAGRPARC